MRSLAFLLLSTLAWLDPSAAAAEGIPEKTLKELKATTVYIKVEFRDAVGPLLVTGSGFLVHAEGQTGYVVTNDHVASPQPGQIRVGNPKLVFRSGTPAESTVDAVVVASDPVRDLAVLKVSGRKDLPRSLTVDVQTRIGDGYFGWPECGPFDGILVTAAAGHVPPPLVQQLKPGGRMVIPLGASFALQYLVLVERNADDGRVTTRQLLPVSFVPLTSGSRQR